MSFTDEIKNELLESWLKKQCCKNAEAIGMLLFLKKSGDIRLCSTNEALVRHFRSLLKKCFDVTADITVINGKKFKINFSAAENLPLDVLLAGINDSLFQCPDCKAAFLRGAFLAAGQCCLPEKEYHLEFISNDEPFSFAFCRLLIDMGFDAKTFARQQKSGCKYIIYIKSSENIEDFLTLIGAQKATLTLMETKIMKDVRNNINRKTNFETANIKKSSVSCAKQLEAIKKLQNSGRLNTLPEDLYELAIARLENIDLSLTELGKLFGLSRSGVHHRLQKLIDLSENK